MINQLLFITKKLLARILLLAVFEICFVLGNTSWAATKEITTKSLMAIQCSAEFFKDYEKLAKQEVATYRMDKLFRAQLIEFISLLYRYKKGTREYCTYSSDDYLALLWKATHTLKRIKEKRGPFPPDTFVAFAESRLDRLWNEGFRLGWNGFPKNPKQSLCLLQGVLQNLIQCEKLNPEFFAAIRAKKIPDGW